MGIWTIGMGKLIIYPSPDNRVISEYISFSKRTNPYENYDEYFENPWFFDDNNVLQSCAGKFDEPSMWLEYIKDFFGSKGYEVQGDPKIISECDEINFWEICDIQNKQYLAWIKRKEVLERQI